MVGFVPLPVVMSSQGWSVQLRQGVVGWVVVTVEPQHKSSHSLSKAIGLG